MTINHSFKIHMGIILKGIVLLVKLYIYFLKIINSSFINFKIIKRLYVY
jgi:hypothetical protein